MYFEVCIDFTSSSTSCSDSQQESMMNLTSFWEYRSSRIAGNTSSNAKFQITSCCPFLLKYSWKVLILFLAPRDKPNDFKSSIDNRKKSSRKISFSLNIGTYFSSFKQLSIVSTFRTYEEVFLISKSFVASVLKSILSLLFWSNLSF